VRFGLGLALSRLDASQLAAASKPLGAMLLLPFDLPLSVFVRHLKSSVSRKLESRSSLRGKLGRNMGAKPLF
jgi:hypothetical protein